MDNYPTRTIDSPAPIQPATQSAPPPSHPQPSPLKIKWLLLGVIFILFILTFGGLYLFLTQTKTNAPTAKSTAQTIVTPTPTPAKYLTTPTPDPTSSWNSYTSSDNSYSFKYPADGNWKMPSNSTVDVQCPHTGCPKSYNIYSFTIGKSDKTSIQQFISSLNTTNPDINSHATPYIADYKLIKINGLDAVEILNPTGPQSGSGPIVSVFVIIDGVGYLYNYTYLDPNLNSVTKLDQLPAPNPDIISTIKFTDQASSKSDATSGWKVYDDASQGVTLKYPPDWFVSSGKNTNACAMFSDASTPYPPYAHTVISLCSYPEPAPSEIPDSNNSTGGNTNEQITLNGYQGIRVQQTSNWGIGESVFLPNPKGGSSELRILMGDTNIYNLLLSTFKFTQ